MLVRWLAVCGSCAGDLLQRDAVVERHTQAGIREEIPQRHPHTFAGPLQAAARVALLACIGGQMLLTRVCAFGGFLLKFLLVFILVSVRNLGQGTLVMTCYAKNLMHTVSGPCLELL